jgi:hypothetical protein
MNAGKDALPSAAVPAKRRFMSFLLPVLIPLATLPVASCPNPPTPTPPPFETFEEAASPEVVYDNRDASGNGALFDRLVPDVTEFIHTISLEVVQIIAVRPEDVERVTRIMVIVDDTDGVASKTGQAPFVTITLSSRYLAEMHAALNYDDGALIAEIGSIFTHELTHCYSPNDVPYADIAGLVEGLADAVVIQSGHRSADLACPGGTWDQGYGTSAFFFVWLDVSKYPELNIIENLTLGMADADGPEWPAAEMERLTETPVSDLWSEYQTNWPWPVPEDVLTLVAAPADDTVFPSGTGPSFWLNVEASDDTLVYNLGLRATDLTGDGYSISIGPYSHRERNVRISGILPKNGGVSVPGSASQWQIWLFERDNPTNVIETLEVSIPVTWE